MIGGVIKFDLGKAIQAKRSSSVGRLTKLRSGSLTKHQPGTFTRTGSLNKPPTILSTAVTKLRARARLKGYHMNYHLKEMLTRFPDSHFCHPDNQSNGTKGTDQLFSSNYIHKDGEADCKRCDLTRLVRRQQRSTNHPIVHYGLIGSGNQVIKDANMRDRLRKHEGIICFEMEAAGLMDDFPCLVIRGVCGMLFGLVCQGDGRLACITTLTLKQIIPTATRTKFGNRTPQLLRQHLPRSF